MNSDASDQLPGRRGLFASVFVHAVAEYAAWITVLVVAFNEGGSSAAATAVTAQLVPAAILAPVVGTAGDRFARHRVLATSFAVQAVAAGGIALALLTASPLAVVYLLASVFTIATIATPATVASLLVHHARTPAQLTTWNTIRSFVRAAGSLTGPLLTALALALADPSTVFVVLFVVCAATAVLTGLNLPRDDRLASTLSIAAVLDDAWRGVVYVSKTPAPRRVVGYIGGTEMLTGALDLVFVAVAFEQLDSDGSAVALIAATFAFGTLFAAAVASRRVVWRLSGLITLGAALMTVPMLVLGETSLLLVVLSVAVVLGTGNGFIEIGTQTLLQRSCNETMTSRAYGALDSTAMIAASIGAVIAGRLIDDHDLTWVVVTLGITGAIALVGGSIQLRATERSLTSTDPAVVSCLCSVSFLASLPQPTLERLARSSQHRSAAAGNLLMVEGERGDEFFVLMSGTVEVRAGGDVVRRMEAPGSFGEVALLHDNVRTATVTTTDKSELVVLRQRDFLDAISRTATSSRGALDVAERYRRPAKPS